MSRTVSVGDNPQDVVVNPKTSAVYVLDDSFDFSGSVSEIVAGGSTSTETSTVGGPPISAVVSKDGNSLYVGEFNNGVLDVFNSSGPLGTPTNIGAGSDVPQSLVLGVANSGSAGFLYIGPGINVAMQGWRPAVDPSQRVFTYIGGGFISNWLAMSTDGNTLYATIKDDNALYLLDTSVPIDPATAPIDPNTGLPAGPPVTSGPIALQRPPGTQASVVAVNPVGGAVYVLGNDYATGNAYVNVLNASGTSQLFTKVLSGLDTTYGAQGMAVSPNGKYLYVTSTLAGGSLAGTVTVYDTTNNYSVVTTLTGFTNPYSVAFSPGGQYVYVANNIQGSGPGFVTVLGL